MALSNRPSCKDVAAAAEGLVIFRHDLDGLVQVGQGLVQLVLEGQRMAALAIRFAELRVLPHHLVEIGHRFSRSPFLRYANPR